MLSVSKGAGVDIFSRSEPSEFIFFQGHPEYEALTLQREYMRDIRRYLAGEQSVYPCIPAGYFDVATTAALEEFRIGALTRRDPALIDRPSQAGSPAGDPDRAFRRRSRDVPELDRISCRTQRVSCPRRCGSGQPAGGRVVDKSGLSAGLTGPGVSFRPCPVGFPPAWQGAVTPSPAWTAAAALDRSAAKSVQFDGFGGLSRFLPRP